MVLTHGAGSDSNQPILLAVEAGLAPLPVHRFDFPYRRKPGKRPPDRAPKLIASILEEVQGFSNSLDLDPSRLVLAGRSMGGRMCSMAVAEGLDAAALVLLSYPLHPAGKPEKLRTEHFPDVDVPCLFISGDRDPFGSPDEFAEHVGHIKGRVEQVWLPGANHSPKPMHDETIINAVREFLATV